MKKTRKNKRFSIKRLLLLSVIFSGSLLMASGYAILNQRIKLEAKVNLYASDRYLWKQIKENFLKETGTGFHESIESGKYVFIGNDEENYINIDNSLWRIISVEQDHTIKIVKWDDNITKYFDETGNRTEQSTYCTTLEYGCNGWNSQSLLVNDNITGTVENNSALYNYLNQDFYATLSDTIKSKIAEHAFNIGPVEINESTNLIRLISQEQEQIWEGYVGIPSISDYIYTNNLDTNTTILEQNLDTSFLTNFSNEKIKWSINPLLNDSSRLWVINNKTLTTKNANGKAEQNDENNNENPTNYLALPTVYLKDTVKLVNGTGTHENPFTIE